MGALSAGGGVSVGRGSAASGRSSPTAEADSSLDLEGPGPERRNVEVDIISQVVRRGLTFEVQCKSCLDDSDC